MPIYYDVIYYDFIFGYVIFYYMIYYVISITWFQVGVLLITVGLLAGGAYGLSQLKQDFDPDWFLPPDSKGVQYNKANDKVRLCSP